MFSATVAKGGRGKAFVPLGLLRGLFCPSGRRAEPASSCLSLAMPCPACPSVTCVGLKPRQDGMWGNWGSHGAFPGAAGFLQPAALVTSAGDCQGVALQRLMPAREKAWTEHRGGRAVGARTGWGGWGPSPRMQGP